MRPLGTHIAISPLSLGERLAKVPVQSLNAADQVFSFRRAGCGPTAVLLHGIGSSSASWLAQLEQLQASFDVVAWDAPGYGRSAPLEVEAPIVGDYADALRAFMNALGIERAHLVGHSLGALIAAEFAGSDPHRVRSLTLADPAIGYGANDPDRRQAKLASRMEMMDRLGPEGLAEHRGPALLSADAPPEALELVRWSMEQLSPQGYGQAANMLATGDLCSAAPNYTGPVLVLCGTEDKITPEIDAQRVALAYPNSRYEALPGLGHVSYVEDPIVFNHHLVEFWSGLR